MNALECVLGLCTAEEILFKHSVTAMHGASQGVAMNDATKNDKEIRAMSGQGNMFSHIFKPITTALCQVMIKGIACTNERVKK